MGPPIDLNGDYRLNVTIESFYADWRLYNDLMVEAFRGMPAEELALKAASDDPMSSTSWPIWAIAGHTAAMRVYWLSRVLGVPGEEATPFRGMDDGWEDHLDQPHAEVAQQLPQPDRQQRQVDDRQVVGDRRDH